MAKMIRDNEELMNFDESCLDFVSVLGRGGCGLVYLMRDFNSQLYVIKSSPFQHLKILEKELRIMLRFRNNPRVVQASSPLLHFGFKPEGCYIFMEFASRGTLHNMISKFRGRPMPENMIGRVSLMILQGLKDLHSLGYVHCNIKPANVLVFPSKAVGEPWDLKLADFSLSKEPSTDSRSLFGGTRQYMPPESIISNGMIGPAVDIWSLGCVVLEMFGGCPMKVGALYSWRLPKLVSPLAEDFLWRCLKVQPSRRATATELLSHPFVRQKLIGVKPRTERVMCPPQRFQYSRRQEGPLMMMVPRPCALIC